MAERMIRRRGRKVSATEAIEECLMNSSSSEEALFKINEIIFEQSGASTRRNVRAPISLPVSYEYEGGAFQGRSYTVSQDGMFIKSAAPPEVGAVVNMKIGLPENEGEIPVTAEVVRRTTMDEASENHSISGMVVLFRKIRSRDRRRINRYVKAQAREMKLPY